LIRAGLGVVLAPVARIHRHHVRQCTGAGGDALQHWLQVLDIRRLVAHAHRHDHLVVAVDSQLAVVGLQIGPAGLHQVALRIGEVPLRLGGWCAVGFPGQAASGHGVSSERLKIRWLQAGVLGSFNGVVSGGGGLGRCCLDFLLVPSLLSCRCIRLLCLRRLGPGLLGFLLPLMCRSGCGFRLHLLAGLADPGQSALLIPQLLRQLTAALALAVLAILLGVEDLGLPHQGIDFLLQLLLSPEHPLMTHGLAASLCVV
jgi:hypothetical protein